MKSEFESWTIAGLAKRVSTGELNLSPSYQRNEVWTQGDQRDLIETIQKRWPLPSLFVLRNADGSCEMVDGKQRALAIFNYLNDNLKGPNRELFSELSAEHQKAFLEYLLPVVVIIDLEGDTKVEQFYAIVNKSGMRLNRPEITKAEFSEAPFHRLIDELASDERLLSLGIFTPRNAIRMSNYELIAEVLATIECGFFDKKSELDRLYEIKDVESPIWTKMRASFEQLVSILLILDSTYPLRLTRFKKRADFLSLSYFFWANREVNADDLTYAHRVFTIISPGIAPSSDCEVLRFYAHHCVSQSHLKTARQTRHQILVDLLANQEAEPSAAQRSVLDYFGIEGGSELLVSHGDWRNLRIDLLEARLPKDHLFGEPRTLDFPL